MQKIAAVSNLVSYYFIALPVGVALMFLTKLRIFGNAFTPLCIYFFANQNIYKYCESVNSDLTPVSVAGDPKF